MADLLRSHPDISVAGEILNPYNPEGIRLHFRRKTAVIKHIKRSLLAQPGKCRGAQTHLLHFRMHSIPLSYLVEQLPDFRYILLYRRSLAEQYVSWKLAKQTGKWVGTTQTAVHTTKCRVDREEFIEWCTAVKSRYMEAVNCPELWRNSVSLSYEALAANPQLALEESIFPFLGVRPVRVNSRLRKQNPRTLAECVENFADVADLLNQQNLELSNLVMPKAKN
ncbi:hypothetical protein THTE_2367 [Thermogutta terrifontis]|uniref:Sulfotransferase n=1 Tax=Thermogutta terrifontis TaxID=1331910 RepID=A0A286RG80_9BACT|nr:hypothetical protein THTE_2367 [Thermogutta terrifontis]